MICLISRFTEAHSQRRVNFTAVKKGLPVGIILKHHTDQVRKQISQQYLHIYLQIHKNSCMIHITITLQEQLREKYNQYFNEKNVSKISERLNTVQRFDLTKIFF